MLAGVSRFSARSLVATATFMGAGAIAAYLFHNDLPVGPAMSWSVTPTAQRLLILQTVPLLASVLLYFLSPPTTADHNQGDKPSPPNTSLRILAFLSTTIQFALSLRLSELTDPRRVISFLLLPVHKAWDPSLAFLAAGALPLAMVLYRYARGNEKPRLGGAWCIPTNTVIDRRLVGGSALFGIGWGLAGICRTSCLLLSLSIADLVSFVFGGGRAVRLD
ncbi:hypothetical protein AX16_005070 [Volvariella volvacea WC 439]|nr:hypothetical protein AX16_005070 [Volvariella volvacea WC 439]